MPDGAPLIDPDLVAGRIVVLLNDRRPGAVKPLLAALERLAPDHPALALLRASYCCQIGEFSQARHVLDDAIAQAPGNANLILRRAEIMFGQADYANAAANAAEVVVMAPQSTRAKSILGLALLKLQKFDAALLCLAESFAAAPGGVDVALALAALSPDCAIEILTQAITATPHLTVLRNALTRRHLCAGNAAQAMRSAMQTREAGLSDVESFCLAAFAQMQQTEWEDAGCSIAQALSLVPGNFWAMRLAAALGRRHSGRIEPLQQQDAVAAEQALFAGGTILPGTFRALLAESQRSGPVLDLFCGSGLNAITGQDICPGPWTGIDSDCLMMELCAGRGLYRQLELCSPRYFLAAAGPYPIILLNEALGYLASPEPWFDCLRGCLSASGMAFAAIPTGRAGLNGHGLFAHDLERIAEQAAQAGLSLSVKRSGALRHSEGIPLHGVIASLRKR